MLLNSFSKKGKSEILILKKTFNSRIYRILTRIQDSLEYKYGSYKVVVGS